MRMDEEQGIGNAPGMCWRSGSGSTIWDPVVLIHPFCLVRRPFSFWMMARFPVVYRSRTRPAYDD